MADDFSSSNTVMAVAWEDILDTGNTLKYIHDMLSKRNPESIGVVTLLDKPARRIADIKNILHKQNIKSRQIICNILDNIDIAA